MWRKTAARAAGPQVTLLAFMLLGLAAWIVYQIGRQHILLAPGIGG